MDKPLVSVVIPCYNDGKFIDEAVGSIKCQIYQNYEIIIVNDGSTDIDTINKLNDYNIEKVAVYHTINRGLPAARNYGICKAKGEYILTLDADDKFHNSFIAKAIKIIQNNLEIGVVTCGVQHFGNSSGKWLPGGGIVKDFLLHNNACGNSLFRKICWEQVKGYNEEMRAGYEDWDFWIKITKLGWKVEVIPEYLFFYRMNHKNQLSQQANKKRDEILKEIVRNNLDIYTQYADYVISEKEKYIQSLQNLLMEKEKNISQILNSNTYKIVKLLLKPLNIIKSIF